MADNVLLVVIDALRRDFVSTYRNNSPRSWDRTHPADLTPTIDRLAENGERFDNAYACINATDPSLTTIRSGQYPARHGVLNHGRRLTDLEYDFANSAQSIPEFLPDHTTFAVDTMGRWHSNGFDQYINPNKTNRSKIITIASSAINCLPMKYGDQIRSWYDELLKFRPWVVDTSNGTESNDAEFSVPFPPAEVITETTIDALDSFDGNWFGLVHYWDTHSPYAPINAPRTSDDIDYTHYDNERELAELLDEVTDEWRAGLETQTPNATTVGEITKRIVSGTRLVDEQLDRLIQELERRGIRDDTAIIITSDHGECITERGIYFNHHGLYEQIMNVPFVISAPGFSGVESDFVQHVDICPTILDLLDQSPDVRLFNGNSLVPDESGSRSIDRDSVFLEERNGETKQGIRTEQWKYIRNTGEREKCRYCGVIHGGKKELYNTEDDPTEQNNEYTDNVEVANELDRRLSNFFKTLSAPSASENDINVEDEEVLENLDALGYI